MVIRLLVRVICSALVAVAVVTAVPAAAEAHAGAPPTLIVVPGQPAPGDMVEIIAADLSPSIRVDLSIEVASGPVFLATMTTDSLGHGQRRVTIPSSLAAGSYQLAARAADGAVIRRDLRLVGEPAAPAGEGADRLGPRLAILVAFGAGAAILVLGLVIVWSLYHGTAARLHHHREGRRLDRSPDPLFARPARRRFRRSNATDQREGR
ncbi:MAG: hypothetical protein H0V36_01760 [Chloroflexi bacterium]|nr:hypothetical protein [Chloroflexota bacterium]